MRTIASVPLVLVIAGLQLCCAQVSSIPTVMSKATGQEHPVLQRSEYRNIRIDGKLRLGKLLKPNSWSQIPQALGPPEKKETDEDITGNTIQISYNGMLIYYFEDGDGDFLLSNVIIKNENHFIEVGGQKIRPGSSYTGKAPYGKAVLSLANREEGETKGQRSKVIEYFVGQETDRGGEGGFARAQNGSIVASDVEFLDIYVDPDTGRVNKIVLHRQII